MPKIKNLSPKFKIPDAEKELELQMGQVAMGSQQGGLSLFSNKFKRGYGDSVFGSDENGIWLGAAEWADAPFRVAMDGTVTVGSGYTKTNIFKQDDVPTSISIGDLWFDTNDSNKLYRAGSVGADEIGVGEWEVVQDTGIAAAQGTADGAVSDASDAQDTADTKMTIFAQDAVPTALAAGDLWFDTNDDNKPYVATAAGDDEIGGGEWEIVDDQRAADAILKAGTSQTLTGDIEVGGSNLKMDGANNRFVSHDGANNRAVMGDV